MADIFSTTQYCPSAWKLIEIAGEGIDCAPSPESADTYTVASVLEDLILQGWDREVDDAAIVYMAMRRLKQGLSAH